MVQEFDLSEALETLAGDDLRASGLGTRLLTTLMLARLVSGLVRDN